MDVAGQIDGWPLHEAEATETPREVRTDSRPLRQCGYPPWEGPGYIELSRPDSSFPPSP
jgi:hypothetical protein